MFCRKLVADQGLKRQYGEVFKLMASTPGRPSLPASTPAALGEVPALLRDAKGQYQVLVSMIEVGSVSIQSAKIMPCVPDVPGCKQHGKGRHSST